MITGLSLLFLVGCNAQGRFSLTSSRIGGLANVTANSSIKGNHYTIQIDVVTKGVHNLLRGKRTERYRSVGRVRKGKYYSDRMTIERWMPKLHSLHEYRFDYKKKKIIWRYREWIGKKLIKDSTVTLGHFGHNDYLTVLNNAMHDAPKGTSGWRKNYTVGGAEAPHGNVPVYISNNPKLLKRWGGVRNGTLIQMGIHKRLFTKGKGSMTILLDAKKRPIKFIFNTLDTLGSVTGTPRK
jgi:hypothetical protein